MRMIFRSAQKNIFFSSYSDGKVCIWVEKLAERGGKTSVSRPFFSKWGTVVVKFSPACARPAFPVCKKLAGGVECLTEGLSFDARESFLFIEASFQFGMKHSREGETVVLTVCRNAT